MPTRRYALSVRDVTLSLLAARLVGNLHDQEKIPSPEILWMLCVTTIKVLRTSCAGVRSRTKKP